MHFDKRLAGSMSQASSNSIAHEIKLPVHLVIRPDVILHPQRDVDYFVLEDTAQGRFFRLGKAEAAFVRELQVTPNAQAVWQRMADNDFTRLQAAMLCRWLSASGLLVGDTAVPKTVPSTKDQLTNFFSAIYFLEVPIFDPDRILIWKAARCTS
jgi:hypothetical protein